MLVEPTTKTEILTNAKNYRRLLAQCLREGQFVGPRGKMTRELLDAEIHLAPTKTLVRGKMDRPYAERELVWYLRRDRDPSYVAEIAKLWENCRNPDGMVNSNYGRLVGEQHVVDFGQPISELEWAVDRLIQDKDTRQAVMVYHKPEHHWEGNRDLPCTLTESFMIRNGELITRAHMRSCDLWYGLPFDLIWHQYLHNQVLTTLRGYYPLSDGKIIMRLDSAHLYEKHWGRAEKFLTDPPEPEVL